MPAPTVLTHLFGAFCAALSRRPLGFGLGKVAASSPPGSPALPPPDTSQTAVPCVPWAVRELRGSARGSASPASSFSCSGSAFALGILRRQHLPSPGGNYPHDPSLVLRWLRAERGSSSSSHAMDRGAFPGASFPGRSHSWDALSVPARPHRRLSHRVPFGFFGWGSQLFGNSDLCRHRHRGHRCHPVASHASIAIPTSGADGTRSFGTDPAISAAAESHGKAAVPGGGCENQAPVTERCPRDNPGAGNPKIPGLLGGQTSVTHVTSGD